MTERFPDSVRRWMLPAAIWAIGLGTAVNSAATLLLFDANRDRVAQIEANARQVARESRERRDQACLGDEREHLQVVVRLQRTYNYLLSLTASEKQETLNRSILRGLPEQEQDAHTDTAPKFCDEPGIGLPEPDPVVPDRPEGLGGP